MRYKIASSNREIKERIWQKGLTIKSWAKLNGIKPDTFYHWMHRRNKKKNRLGGFIEIRIIKALEDGGIITNGKAINHE